MVTKFQQFLHYMDTSGGQSESYKAKMRAFSKARIQAGQPKPGAEEISPDAAIADLDGAPQPKTNLAIIAPENPVPSTHKPPVKDNGGVWRLVKKLLRIK